MNMFTLLQQKKLNLSSRVAGAYKEVANYQDLLLYSPKKQVILILGKTLVRDFVKYTQSLFLASPGSFSIQAKCMPKLGWDF